MRKIGIAAKLLLCLFFLWLVLRQVHVGEALSLVRQASAPALVTALLCMAAANLSSAVRWRLMLALAGARIGFWRVVLINLAGYFFSTFLPGSAGGDVLKVFYLAPPRESGKLLSTTLLTRMLGTAAMFATGLAVMPLADARLQSQPWWTTFGAFLWAGLAVSAAPFLPGFDRLGLKIISRPWMPEKLRRVAHDMLEPLFNWRRHPGTAVSTLALSFIYQITGPFLVIYWCAVSLGVKAGLVDMAMVAVAASAAFVLPVSLNGLGVVEGVIVALLCILGETPERAFLLAVLFRLGFSIQAAAGGVVYFFMRRKPAI